LRRPASTTLVFLSLAVAAGLALLPLLCSPHPNLVLITIDTLRADHVGVYGDAAAETPTLDALARRGVRFARARSAAPLTGPSHATILTGVYPPQHGVRDNVNFVLDNRHPTLAGLLKEKGYRTAAFVGAYPLASAFGFGRGFERFGEGFHETAALGQGAERPGNEVADAALEWLASTGRDPFFVWIHLYDPHAPYTPPAPYAERFRDRPYDGEIAFADAQVGRVLEALRTARRDANTLVVVLSDHGEGLGEHGEATHGMLVYDSTLHVPWIMAGPGVPAGRVVADEVGTVDVLPTLLGLVHASPPSGLPGRDLRPALAERSVRSEPLYAESLFGRLNCRWSALRSWTSMASSSSREASRSSTTWRTIPASSSIALPPSPTRSRACAGHCGAPSPGWRRRATRRRPWPCLPSRRRSFARSATPPDRGARGRSTSPGSRIPEPMSACSSGSSSR
jgi:arylsulfatase A-like enzyme